MYPIAKKPASKLPLRYVGGSLGCLFARRVSVGSTRVVEQDKTRRDENKKSKGIQGQLRAWRNSSRVFSRAVLGHRPGNALRPTYVPINERNSYYGVIYGYIVR